MKKYIYAIFLLLAVVPAKATYTLTVSTLGPVSPSIVYSSNPATGIQCGSSSTACIVSFPAGSTVTLTAVSASTVAFAGWAGEAGCGSNLSPCKILMNTNRVISARFNPTLSISLFGNGAGTVSDATGTINCGIANACGSGAKITQSYYPGTLINLTAVHDGTSTFTGWTGGPCAGSATSTCGFNLNTSQVTIATFTSVGPFTILVSTGGTGSGRITSSPVGINCGSTSTACSVGFAANVSVTLTASPNAGHIFTGWANAGCSGTSTCVILSTSAWQSTGAYAPSAYFY